MNSETRSGIIRYNPTPMPVIQSTINPNDEEFRANRAHFEALLQQYREAFHRLDTVAQAGELLHRRLRLSGACPELRRFAGALQAFNLRLQTSEVKDARQSPSGDGEPPESSHSACADPSSRTVYPLAFVRREIPPLPALSPLVTGGEGAGSGLKG